MNNIERDIYVLECAKLHIEQTANRQDYNLEALDRLRNAVDNAKEALEKQQVFGIINLVCPVCTTKLDETDRYCKECGQKIKLLKQD